MALITRTIVVEHGRGRQAVDPGGEAADGESVEHDEDGRARGPERVAEHASVPRRRSVVVPTMRPASSSPNVKRSPALSSAVGAASASRVERRVPPAVTVALSREAGTDH